ncbi:phosphonoacetaldehyde hydrolase [Limobrevibacterium gyesilva]|uniref:Phosphonoacetaldehyde hydrolase n=1 Tax=Limobrevibacterium gyesilva TaxID=2991712 RepID=A0AA41YNV1_9PROT|nr:phosphonoacetaldehyde hydrolase [Limobrevibacterium gyesilva]MCW3475807.1 phosphonoacetaldehyde hydrolase [Limobrevibacterium gyesilva]
MKLQAVILDWAGTVLDHGSRAPMGAFVRAFAQFGVAISIADARGPMGMAKRDHIRMVGQAPAVAAAWRARHGRDFNEADIDALFAVFEPMNVAAVKDHADLIPGALDALAELRRRGLRIGSTTGYTRPIMAELMPIAAAAGYAPEIVVCAGDLPQGRPSPLMMWHAMAQMGVWPAATVVKVDDTPPGIGEGLNAGTWTVGLALTGNIAGLSAAELAAATDGERAQMRARATQEMQAAGADLVIDSIADLPGAIDAIEARMARGEKPRGG